MEWLKKNLLQIAIIVISIAMGWAVLSARVAAIEKQIEQYPSADYFDLKFEQLDKSIKENHDSILEHLDT